ncbi:YhfC family glutamic-type intramembrane protease [Clostridium sp.]|uniref:YhfC family intramembrane metalloprotease n=1 Tax=Clostridium sp. TaxID=1506 RepID=UPI002621BD75|nr:YhfC family glutamic-type intramembrane protease [Clostridium sp.]
MNRGKFIVVSISLVVSLFLNVFICFLIPLVASGYFIFKKKRYMKALFIGGLTFLISQIFLRIPLIKNVLSNMNWYIEISVLYPILYIMFLSLSAGVFEEIGRYLAFKIVLKNNKRWIDGIAFGIGHGGIEAIILLGIPSLITLVKVISLNLGYSSKVNTEILIKLYSMNIEVLIGGVERILAIIIHVGLSLLILYGINKKEIRYLFIAIMLHGLVNFCAVFLGQLGGSVFIVECVIGIFALGFLIFTFKSKKIFENF